MLPLILEPVNKAKKSAEQRLGDCVEETANIQEYNGSIFTKSELDFFGHSISPKSRNHFTRNGKTDNGSNEAFKVLHSNVQISSVWNFLPPQFNARPYGIPKVNISVGFGNSMKLDVGDQFMKAVSRKACILEN